MSSSGGSIPVLSKAVLPGHISCLVSCISVSIIIAIQIGAVDEGAVFNKSIYGCLADEIHPQNALRAVSSRALIGKCTHTCCRFRCDKKAFFSSVETTYEEDANRDAEVPIIVE